MILTSLVLYYVSTSLTNRIN